MFELIECRPHPTVVFLFLLTNNITALGLLALNIMVFRAEGDAVGFDSPTIRLMVWIATFSWLIVVFHASPRLSVSSAGINLHMIYADKLVKWEDIQSVEISPLRTYIIADKLSLFNLIAGILVFRFQPLILFSTTSTNFLLVMEIIREMAGDRIKNTIL